MNIALRKPMSLSEFLAWEERQELRYEFDGFQQVAMTGGTVGHDRITFNLHKTLDARLAGSRCRPFGPNVKIIAGRKVRYPGALVTCSPTDFGATVIDNPVVVFEVVSEDSARIDRIEKVRVIRLPHRFGAMRFSSRPASAPRSSRVTARSGPQPS